MSTQLAVWTQTCSTADPVIVSGVRVIVAATVVDPFSTILIDKKKAPPETRSHFHKAARAIAR
jgi:hypothetical protein